jgi:hypothetical protein
MVYELTPQDRDALSDYPDQDVYQDKFIVGINDCEYLKRWRTTCLVGSSTNPDNEIVYNSYSCALFFCKYPGKSCEVKK